jgi:hypothetical protein
MAEMSKDQRAEAIVSSRQANHPYENDGDFRLVGFVVDAEVAGLSEALFALDIIRARVNAYASLTARVAELEAALAAARDKLSASASSSYCLALDKFQTTPCLGWEEKVRTGKYTVAEHEAHAEANRLIGSHKAFAEAAKIINAAMMGADNV